MGSAGQQALAVMEWRGSRYGGTGHSRKAPTHWVGVWGFHGGRFWWGRPHPSPLWIPASAGMTWRGCGNAEGIWSGSAPPGAPLDTGFRRYDGEGFGAASAGGDGVARVSLRRDGPFSKGPYDGVAG